MGTFGNQNIQFFIEFPIGTGPKKGVHWNTLSVCQSALGKSSKNKLSFFSVRLTVRGGGSAPSALTVSKCAKFGPIFPIMKWGPLATKIYNDLLNFP